MGGFVFAGPRHDQDLSSIASFTAASNCRSLGSLPLSCLGSFSVRWYSATPIGFVFVLSENSTTMSSFPIDGLSPCPRSLSLSRV